MAWLVSLLVTVLGVDVDLATVTLTWHSLCAADHVALVLHGLTLWVVAATGTPGAWDADDVCDLALWLGTGNPAPVACAFVCTKVLTLREYMTARRLSNTGLIMQDFIARWQRIRQRPSVLSSHAHA